MLNFKADYKAIAEGIFGFLQDAAEKGDESYLAALAFGMLPAPFMNMAENSFIEKLAEPSVKLGLPLQSVIKTIKKDHKDTISEFNHQLSLELLRVAKKNNNLVV